MKRINWNKYKFHCSALPCLMTKSRIKSDPLSETAKAFLRELWIREKFGREKVMSNKFCDKGLLVEQDSLDLVTKVISKKFLAKNKETYANDYLVGTPDVTSPLLIDIKSSWDIWTFASVDKDKAAKDYGWQMFGYMWMLGKKQSKLIYALVDTPEDIMEDELRSLSYKRLQPEQVIGAERNYTFPDIPAKKRVKAFPIKFEQEKVAEVVTILDAAREYLKGIRL